MATDPEIMNALMAKLYQVILGDDPINNQPIPGGNYISFARPGIGVNADDLEFGFLSQNQDAFDAGADFADLVNTIPVPSDRWQPNDRKVTDQYERILRTSVYPVANLSPEEEERLDRAKSLLIKEAEIVDLITGQVKKTFVDSPLYEQYQERKGEYVAALLKYKSLQADLLGRPDDVAARQAWSLYGPVYEQNVTTALGRWIAGGKNIVEQALGIINSLEGRGYEKYWLDLATRRDRSIRSDLDGNQYLVTKYFPSKFWDDNHTSSWTRFSMSHDEVHKISTASETKWGGKTGGNFGLWNFGGSANYHEIKTSSETDTNFESIEFDVLRVPLRRSWWDANIFESKAWKFHPDLDSTPLSDGATPPSGQMVGYVSSLIIVRNVVIKMDTTSEKNSYAMSEISGSASGGWGPFSLKANYYRKDERTTHDFVKDNNSITIEGMQIIGFECTLIPKSPNPDEELNWVEGDAWG